MGAGVDTARRAELIAATLAARGEDQETVHEQVVLEICENPVFVIGAPRSGTSVLSWSVASHPDFWTMPETDFLYWLFARGHLDDAMTKSIDKTETGWLTRLGATRAELTEALGVGINALFSKASGGLRWVDQSPTYTLATNELARLFPGAMFLHILRDGRSVVNSMINSGFSTSWATDFRLACRTWATFVERAESFAEARPARCTTVPYASLVADPQSMFAEIHEFLNAPQDPGSADFFMNNRINSSFGKDGPPAQYTGPSEPWETWTIEQRETFNQEAGETMAKYGFAPVAV